ncbi:hypothetical protein LPJ72_000034 [Coemansia sp. Benny D160-2]|nr:hypothetical protein LPJ72_000034 [Coemansia sp. Benny D160-2]
MARSNGGNLGLLDLEECTTDSPYYRSKVRTYEEYVANLETSIQGLSRASKSLQTASVEHGTKYVDTVRRVTAISQLSPIKDSETEWYLSGFSDVLAEIERNRAMQCDQIQQILVQPMEEMAESGLVAKVRGSRRQLDAVQNEYETQLTRLMGKKPTEPFIENQERDVEATKTQYIHRLQTHSLDLNRVAAVKNIEFIEGFLSLMYAQYAFYHQAFSSMRDFEPTMRKLGEHIAQERRQVEQHLRDAADLVVPLKSASGAHSKQSTNSMHDDTDGYVQVGQQDDDIGAFSSLRGVEGLEEDASDIQAALDTGNQRQSTADGHLPLGGGSAAASADKRASKDSDTAVSKRQLGGDGCSAKSSKSHHRRSLASISLSPNGLFQISGYLFLRSQYSLMASWQRRWFEIKDGQLVHFQRDDEKNKETVPLHLCKVKRCSIQDRRNVFELIAPNRTYILQAESSHELNAWKACLKQAIEASLYSHAPEGNACNMGALAASDMMGPLARANSQPLSRPRNSMQLAGSGGGATSLEIHTSLGSQLTAMHLGVGGASMGLDNDLQATRMAKMRAVPGNDLCVDCGRKGPEWAAINLGVLMCIECSGIHRSLGVHVSKVRSVKLDNWEPELIHIMLRLGNRRVNQILECVGPKEDEPSKPAPQSPRDKKEPYIVQKYANRLYVKPRDGTKSDGAAGHALTIAARTADMPLALEALAQGADPDAHDPTTGKTPLMEAVSMGDFGMLELLLLWGANPNTRGKVTATSYMNDSPRSEQQLENVSPASFGGRDSSDVKTAGGSDLPKECAAYGGTALHLATRLGNVRVVWYLVRKNAQWDTPDAYGLLPLDIALEDSNVQVVMALRYAAFQKMSGLPPGTLGSRRSRANGGSCGGNGSGSGTSGNAAEPVDILDVDDSFIRDWAVPPYSPCIEQDEDTENKDTGADDSDDSKEVSLEFVDVMSSSSPRRAGADDMEFGELQEAGH